MLKYHNKTTFTLEKIFPDSFGTGFVHVSLQFTPAQVDESGIKLSRFGRVCGDFESGNQSEYFVSEYYSIRNVL